MPNSILNDYLLYNQLFKTNYKKGVHFLKNLLNSTAASEFAEINGGISVILGAPLQGFDANSAELLETFGESVIVDQGVLSWFKGFYPGDTYDAMFAVLETCEALLNNDLHTKRLGLSSVCLAKCLIGAVGLVVSNFADMDAVFASAEAMEAILASSICIKALLESDLAVEEGLHKDSVILAAFLSATAMIGIANSRETMLKIFNTPELKTAMFESVIALTAMTNAEVAMDIFTDNILDLITLMSNPDILALMMVSRLCLEPIIYKPGVLEALMEVPAIADAITASELADIIKLEKDPPKPVAPPNMEEVMADIDLFTTFIETPEGQEAIIADKTAMAKVWKEVEFLTVMKDSACWASFTSIPAEMQAEVAKSVLNVSGDHTNLGGVFANNKSTACSNIGMLRMLKDIDGAASTITGFQINGDGKTFVAPYGVAAIAAASSKKKTVNGTLKHSSGNASFNFTSVVPALDKKEIFLISVKATTSGDYSYLSFLNPIPELNLPNGGTKYLSIPSSDSANKHKYLGAFFNGFKGLHTIYQVTDTPLEIIYIDLSID